MSSITPISSYERAMIPPFLGQVAGFLIKEDGIAVCRRLRKITQSNEYLKEYIKGFVPYLRLFNPARELDLEPQFTKHSIKTLIACLRNQASHWEVEVPPVPTQHQVLVCLIKIQAKQIKQFGGDAFLAQHEKEPFSLERFFKFKKWLKDRNLIRFCDEVYRIHAHKKQGVIQTQEELAEHLRLGFHTDEVRLTRMITFDIKDDSKEQNRLTEVPPEILLLPNLKDLRLSNHRISRLDPQLARLNVDWMDVSKNLLGRIPHWMSAKSIRIKYYERQIGDQIVRRQIEEEIIDFKGNPLFPPEEELEIFYKDGEKPPLKKRPKCGFEQLFTAIGVAMIVATIWALARRATF